MHLIIPFARYQLFVYLLTGLFMLVLSPTILAADGTKAKQPQLVIVAPAELQTISDRLEALGTARANESVNITSNTSEKIREIHFEDSQRVHAGEVLVVLEQDEEQANLQQALAQLHERKLALQRSLSLEKQKLAPTDALDRARLAVEEAQANISAIQARINERIIRAPFNGIVGLRQISIGSRVEAGSLITTLDDTSTIKLDFGIPAIYLAQLKPGMEIIALAAATGKTEFHGTVKSIDSRVDPVTRSVQVRALLPNSEGLIIPGMLMHISLLQNTRKALLIPETALLPLGEKQFVMLRAHKDGEDVAEQRQVHIGIRIPGKVEILQGLEEQDQVITHGSSKVKPGKPIKVLAVDDGTRSLDDLIKGRVLKGSRP